MTRSANGASFQSNAVADRKIHVTSVVAWKIVRAVESVLQRLRFDAEVLDLSQHGPFSR